MPNLLLLMDKTLVIMKYFEETYPNISQFIADHGELYLGNDIYNMSLVTLATEEAVIWQSSSLHPSIDQALDAAELVMKEWLASSRRKMMVVY